MPTRVAEQNEPSRPTVEATQQARFEAMLNDGLSGMPIPSSVKVEQRLLSLDVFRGFTILVMVLVNNAGGSVSYRQLEHSQWNGWTLTDCVFPSFLWIVGVAITLSLGKKLKLGNSPGQLLSKVFRRTVILYVLGLLIYVYPTMSISHQRLLGVLQRIAICYLIASLIYLYTSVRTQIAFILLLFVWYWMMMALIPVPGYGAGNLSLEGNFAHYVDRIILGTHNYASTRTWDPEGIISTLPAIATALLGVMAGHVLRLDLTMAHRRNRLFLIGVCMLVAGLLWNIWLPINKKLWTDSFATFMAGLDFVLFAALIWVVDERGYSRYLKPFVITGMNAIVVYVASEFLSEFLDATSLHKLMYNKFFAPLASPVNASLLWALAFTALMYLLSYVMYRRGWLVRI